MKVNKGSRTLSGIPARENTHLLRSGSTFQGAQRGEARTLLSWLPCNYLVAS